MSLPIRFLAIARREYLEAIDRYELARVGVGFEFEGELERILGIIASDPNRFPIEEAEVRVAPVGTFPYALYYRVRRSTVIVFAVYHQSRVPGGWLDRI